MTNHCELRVVGLKRSGNHAIINWIGRQFPGTKVYFLNSCRPLENPYDTKHSEDSGQTLIFNGYRISRRTDRHADKDCLIYSYENQALREVCDAAADRLHDEWVGVSLTRYDLLILRDPFNMLASSLQRDVAEGKATTELEDRYLKLKALWIEYAREFVGETNHLRHNRTVIAYNEWIRDTGYRRRLAHRLGLVFSDEGVDEVMTIGGGSSFDGTRFHGAGRGMDLTERWRRWMADPLYGELVSDPELADLSSRIFGVITGKEELAGRGKRR